MEMGNPTITINSHTPDGQPTPETVTFAYVVGAGTSPASPIATIIFNWGDGTPNTQLGSGQSSPATSGNVQHTFSTKSSAPNQIAPSAKFTVIVTVTDQLSRQGSTTVTVNVGVQGPLNIPSTTPITPAVPGSTQFVDQTGLANAFVLQTGAGAISSTPYQTPSTSRDTSQTGPSNSKTSISCGISNAKLLMQKIAKGILPFATAYNIGTSEPAGGFFSVLPVSGPDNINQPLPVSGNYGSGFFLSDQNGNQRSLSGLRPSQFLGATLSPSGPSAVSSGAQSLITQPLFNGVYHIVLVNFTSQAGVTGQQVNSGDMQTIQQFLQAIIPIQQNYAQQWGNCSITLDPTIYSADFVIQNNNFNDSALAGNPAASPPTAAFIDNLASTLGFASGGPTAHAFIIISPSSILNNDCNPANGYLGYHSASAVNNVPYIFVPLTTSGLTSTDIADVYQIALSHEVAETCVDPAANFSNPEVCDSCGPNCQSVIRNFYSASGQYLLSSQLFLAGQGPGFSYGFMTNSVTAPPNATTPSNTCPSIPFGSCGYAPPNQQSNNSGISQLIGTELSNIINPNDGTINLLFPNGVTLVGNLTGMPGGAIILRLPIGT
jgi:hypothetical protein